MNRKIVFRAWDKKNKVMINAIFVGLGKVYGMTKTFKPSKELEDVILMQYTGLKDKNGKEIYEGDIVKTDTENIVNIKYNNDFGAYQMGFSSFILAKRDIEELNIKIIGNIYENPELLEEVEEISVMEGTREALDKIVI